MSASSGPPNGIGQPVRRKEDFRLVTGRGRYGDDLALPRMVHAAFVRSPHAHARIRSMDKTAALAVPGALAVLAGADYVADGLKPIPHNAGLVEPPDLVVRLRGMDPIAPPHWPLPIEKARFVGEGVAMVVAETIAAAWHDPIAFAARAKCCHFRARCVLPEAINTMANKTSPFDHDTIDFAPQFYSRIGSS